MGLAGDRPQHQSSAALAAFFTTFPANWAVPIAASAATAAAFAVTLTAVDATLTAAPATDTTAQPVTAEQVAKAQSHASELWSTLTTD